MAFVHDHRDYHLDETSFYTVYPIANLPEIRRSGASIVQTATPPVWAWDGFTAPAANALLEVGERTALLQQGGYPFKALENLVTDFRVAMDQEIFAGLGVNSFCGIQLGTMNSNPPFPAAPAHPVIQLRWRLNTGDVVLYTAKGDGVTNAATTAPVGFPGFGMMQLLWEPQVPRASAWINGTLVGVQENPAVLPNWAAVSPLVSRCGMIMYSGTAVSGLFAEWGPWRVGFPNSYGQG